MKDDFEDFCEEHIHIRWYEWVGVVCTSFLLGLIGLDLLGIYDPFPGI